MKNLKNAGLPIWGCQWGDGAVTGAPMQADSLACRGSKRPGASAYWPGLRVPVGKSLAKPGFRPFGKPRGTGCQRRRYGGRMPLERGGKLAWNQRQGIAVADLDRPTALELAAVNSRPLARGSQCDADARVKVCLPCDLHGEIAF